MRSSGCSILLVDDLFDMGTEVVCLWTIREEGMDVVVVMQKEAQRREKMLCIDLYSTHFRVILRSCTRLYMATTIYMQHMMGDGMVQVD